MKRKEKKEKEIGKQSVIFFNLNFIKMWKRWRNERKINQSHNLNSKGKWNESLEILNEEKNSFYPKKYA